MNVFLNTFLFTFKLTIMFLSPVHSRTGIYHRPNRCELVAIPRKGLTQMELLVVIAVVAILLALLIPATQIVINASRSVQCAANMRQIASAVSLFAADNNMRLPPTRHAPLSSDIFHNQISSHGAHLTDAAMLLMQPPPWFRPHQIAQRAPFDYLDDPRIFYSPTQDLFEPDLASWSSTEPSRVFQTLPTARFPDPISRIGYIWITISERPETDPLHRYRNDSFLLMDQPMPLLTTFGIPTHPHVELRATDNNFIQVAYTDGSVRRFNRAELIRDIPEGHNNVNFARILGRMIGRE